ncbi:MAG TPA: hypothetical protein VMV11_03390 [Acidimicrobiales bacterium]|nr:hypothetical protein [Acidimicrobiales bacterium]
MSTRGGSLPPTSIVERRIDASPDELVVMSIRGAIEKRDGEHSHK